MSVTEKETSNSLYRQWQILSRLPTGKWIGTRELQEMLEREGIEISLRTIQRDLNQIAQRFPIESNKSCTSRLASGNRCTNSKLTAYDKLSSCNFYDG